MMNDTLVLIFLHYLQMTVLVLKSIKIQDIKNLLSFLDKEKKYCENY